MRISPIDLTSPVLRADKADPSGAMREGADVSPHGTGFKNAVKKAVAEVNRLQNQADGLAVKLATGDVEDVHEAMIAMQKAKLALEFTIQVRNKVVEAYQEIMRMQV